MNYPFTFYYSMDDEPRCYKPMQTLSIGPMITHTNTLTLLIKTLSFVQKKASSRITAYPAVSLMYIVLLLF